MGDFINTKGHNYISRATVIPLVLLTAALLVMTILPEINVSI